MLVYLCNNAIHHFQSTGHLLKLKHLLQKKESSPLLYCCVVLVHSFLPEAKFAKKLFLPLLDRINQLWSSSLDGKQCLFALLRGMKQLSSSYQAG